MENTTEITYKVSTHAKNRYVERIMNKSDNNEIQRYIVENEEKITDYINKLIQHGDLIYSGKQTQKDSKGNVIDVYLKNCWCVLVDNKTRNVVTLYKIDLGCGDEFNQQYISKMMDKLNESKEYLDLTSREVEAESLMYKEMIAQNQCQINEYKGMIKNLEELCNAYQTIINNNIIKVSQANRGVAEVVNTLIGKKEF
jgi:hypothetical protein